MSYYTTGSGSIMLRIPSDTARRQLYDDLLGRYDRLWQRGNEPMW